MNVYHVNKFLNITYLKTFVLQSAQPLYSMHNEKDCMVSLLLISFDSIYLTDSFYLVIIHFSGNH